VKLPASTGATTTEWRTRYEDLRAVTAGTGPLTNAPGLGMHLLLQYGLAGWMQKWVLTPSCPTPNPTEPVSGLVPMPGQRDVAVLLADMTLNCLTQRTINS
jgi:hypothetical protein